MGPKPGESGLSPRLFLVAPETITPAALADCLSAACEAGDVASLLVPASLAKVVLQLAEAKGVAVIVSGDPGDVPCDGVQVEATTQAVTEARKSVGKDRFVGAFADASRHFAMEAAEAGADYVALSQNGPTIGGEPIIKWWSEFFEIPCVAFDPVEPGGVDILLPQKPDFIRPSDAMWESSDDTLRIVADLSSRIGTK